MRRSLFCGVWLALFFLTSSFASGQAVTVTARVELVGKEKNSKALGAENVALWLVALENQPGQTPQFMPPAVHPRLVQKNKSFRPHLLVVPVGSTVEFPNHDPFFHNVFSLFEGKRFDLGLYEAGSTREVAFDKPGISYVFCDIHAEMSAVVIALSTPYYGISDRRGQVVIPNVPEGRYTLHVWYEAALPGQLNSLRQEIKISQNNSTLGVLRFPVFNLPASHKNKYGHEYDPPLPDNPAYPHP